MTFGHIRQITFLQPLAAGQHSFILVNQVFGMPLLMIYSSTILVIKESHIE